MIDKKLYKGLFEIGKIIPKTEEEILLFEKYYKTKRFPDVDDIIPSEIIEKKFILESANNTSRENDSQSISMAARNGKYIATELLNKMHRDRDEVEKNESE